MTAKKRFLPTAFAFGFVLYLLVFSSFALFHVYAQNEISDPRGCQIGLWVQNGEKISQTSPPIPVGLVFLFYLSPKNDIVFSSFGKGPLPNRGPPSLILL
jgi:hypothetical protein